METETAIYIQYYNSPCGRLALGSYGNQLCLCDWTEATHHARILHSLGRLPNVTIAEAPSAVTDMAARALDAYFAGGALEFDNPLLHIGTDFRKRVWSELHSIPHGTTVSYATIARRIGRPTAVRAVANAIGANPLSIFVPCHRVTGADGSLTGYAGGIHAKRFLLALEGSI